MSNSLFQDNIVDCTKDPLTPTGKAIWVAVAGDPNAPIAGIRDHFRPGCGPNR